MDTRKLQGLWFRSAEEDHDDRLVYRGESHDFPRSRRPRPSLRIHEDGMAEFGAPGPADALLRHAGTWELDDDILTLRTSGKSDVYKIETLEKDRLILRPERGGTTHGEEEG